MVATNALSQRASQRFFLHASAEGNHGFREDLDP